MLLWINGAFGSGKTQTAFELHRRLPDSFVYDPENVGTFLRRVQPAYLQLPDFQNEPLWRSINRDLLLHIGSNYGGVVLVPMTLVNPAYYHEIITPLRDVGLRVDHIVLEAGPEEIRRRLAQRGEGEGWAADQIQRCLEGLRDPLFENKINTEGRPVPEVAEAIAAHSGLSLSRRRSRFRSRIDQLFTQLRHIR